jgi:hypothetical protein
MGARPARDASALRLFRGSDFGRDALLLDVTSQQALSIACGCAKPKSIAAEAAPTNVRNNGKSIAHDRRKSLVAKAHTTRANQAP